MTLPTSLLPAGAPPCAPPCLYPSAPSGLPPRSPETDIEAQSPAATAPLPGPCADAEALAWVQWASSCLDMAAQCGEGGALCLPAEGLPGLLLPYPPVLFRDELQALERIWPTLQTLAREHLDAERGLVSASGVELTWLELPVQGTAEEALFRTTQALAVELLVALQLSAAMRQGLVDAPPDEWVRSAVGLLNQAQAPYYPRYVLSRNLLSEPSRFERFQDELQSPGMHLNPGNSQDHRIRAIDPWLPKGHTLVDIGCGKATYLRTLAHRYKKAIGFDADPYSRALATQELQAQGLGHVKVFGPFEAQHYVPDFAHVLMTEVLEHMPLETARGLLGRLNGQNAERMVFTVPNRDFNLQYGLAPGDFRHWDHHWEPNAAEFEALMRDSFSAKRWTLQFAPVGDIVDGVSSGCLCVVKRSPPSVGAGRAVSKDWLQGLLK